MEKIQTKHLKFSYPFLPDAISSIGKMQPFSNDGTLIYFEIQTGYTISSHLGQMVPYSQGKKRLTRWSGILVLLPEAKAVVLPLISTHHKQDLAGKVTFKGQVFLTAGWNLVSVDGCYKGSTWVVLGCDMGAINGVTWVLKLFNHSGFYAWPYGRSVSKPYIGLTMRVTQMLMGYNFFFL